jgi:hypothetical protein
MRIGGVPFWACVTAAGVAMGCASAPAPAVVTVPATDTARSTDVYLYRLGRSLIPFRERVINITNRRGYDNQPAWDRDALYYTSQRGPQYDIYRYQHGSHTAVTTTPESEYSAALTPDGTAFTVVRVERDSSQRLWRFPFNGGSPTVVLPSVKPVGYFAWLDSTTLALFVLGSPNTLRIADTRSGEAQIVTSAIGRSIQRVPGGRRASFVQRSGNRWVLKTVDPAIRSNGVFRVDTVATLPDSAEYVVWRSDRILYTAGGSRIYRLERPSTRWVQVVDLSSAGIRRINRLALSQDGNTLAFVADDQ